MWHETLDPNNRPYYFNDSTNETTWEKPEELWTVLDKSLAAADWYQYTTDSGKPYWYNKKTQESVWEVPKVEPEGTETFEDMMERLELGTYEQSLPILVKEPAFWTIPTAGDRRARFKQFKRLQALMERRAESQGRKERIAALVTDLDTKFGEKSVDWAAASALGTTKEHKFAYHMWTSRPVTAQEDQVMAIRAKLDPQVSLDSDWDTLREALRCAAERAGLGDGDSLAARTALELSVTEFYEKEQNRLQKQRFARDRRDRRARESLRARFAELHADGKLTASSKWQDVLPLLAEPELAAACAASSPTDLFWDYIAQLKRRFIVQVGVVEDELTRKGLSVGSLSPDDFCALFAGDSRVPAPLEVHAWLTADEFAVQRRAKREKETLLEY